MTGDLREGGRYHVVLGPDPDDHAAGEIRTCRAPEHLLVGWTWPGEDLSQVELRVTADPSGARLVLTHHRLPSVSAVGYGAGWHAYLDVLAGSLADATVDAPAHQATEDGPGGTGGGLTWDERFTALLPLYRAASGA
ncbi:SRPBCC domain-containing protein [Cellulomonas marina]|uniref:Activator of Hsp90 ATPase homolog 1-like protein n=1 Tax=Cellulomonas marina TaxID=988821 RepID=A0A1I0VLJ4_9CELL|nr:SRPBCC domain-containing protein [Cellulomonas marina]GIG27889.1 hypothetical protein Cma02nite_04890 [Cellulomonas marina]SFA77284.1 Activator of Hsp90 ATPase homolog 1-like protein [Cellulomonas marina]